LTKISTTKSIFRSLSAKKKDLY